MVVNEYVHLFKYNDGTQQSIPTTQGKSKISTTKADHTWDETFSKKLANSTIERAVISPLNSATGGLASPAYSLGTQIVKGGSMAAISGGVATLAMAGVMLAVNKIEQRISRMESKAEMMNNQDNALIRAGSKGYATSYKGSLSGVSSNTIGRG